MMLMMIIMIMLIMMFSQRKTHPPDKIETRDNCQEDKPEPDKDEDLGQGQLHDHFLFQHNL